MRTLAVAAAITAALCPAVAEAHPYGTLGGNPFRIIDRPDSHDAFGLDLAIGGIVGDDQPDELIAFRFDLHGRYIPGDSVGLMFSLPLSAVIITGDAGDEELAIGNIDLGGYFFTAVGSGRTTLVARGTVTLPTASDDLGGLLANAVATQIGRLNDVILVAPDLFALRTSFSLIHDAPGLSLRLDGGLDTPLGSTDDAVEVDHDPIIRLNAGLGLGEGPSQLVLELANLANTGDLEESGDFVHQAAVGVTTRQDDLILGLSASVLLDSVFDDDIDGVAVGLIGSIASTF